MYKFKSDIGEDMVVKFYHKGGKRGDKDNPGKSPKSTICTIYTNDGVKISDGVARAVTEVAESLPTHVAPKHAHLHYKNRFVKLLKTDEGSKLAILRGDNFCKKTGREKSLGKALKAFSKDERTRAWAIIYKPEQVPAEVPA